jgi:hypothetical protein
MEEVPVKKSLKSYRRDADGDQHELRVIWVPGTGGEPYLLEWCEDVCTDDLSDVPEDGRPYLGAGVERRLRGGCHHNWDLHCRVFWRYGIEADAHDGCIGFRVVVASNRTNRTPLPHRDTIAHPIVPPK